MHTSLPTEYTDESLMPFGKWKDVKLKNVPSPYLDWLSGQPGFAQKQPMLSAYIEKTAEPSTRTWTAPNALTPNSALSTLHLTMPIHYPTVQVRQRDGTVVSRPGDPIITSDDYTVAEAAEFLHISRSYLSHLCADGYFPGAYKPINKPKGRWRIPRKEVHARVPTM